MPKPRNIHNVTHPTPPPAVAVPPPDPNRLIRLPEVLQILPIQKSTWWKWVADKKAPAPIHLGRCTCWKYSEVVALTQGGINHG